MKRIIILLFVLISTTSFAQFFQGWGIMAGGTLGRQIWYWNDPMPGKEKLKYLLRWNGEVFAEFSAHPTFRWVTELQYNAKGSKREVNGTTTKYLNHIAAWNNYLMIRKEMFAIIPYVKVGPRLEYAVSSPQNFNKLHITGSAGAGVEFVAYGPVKFITEAHWVPDLTRSYKGDPDIKQHVWELRVGLKFAYGGGGEGCPPVYK